ncbi:hypothetical protein BW43_04135 [Pseudomonas sp. RIT357]|nr:hypothetical protein BW43_04135 [Pseudomonas sp. RIT357]
MKLHLLRTPVLNPQSMPLLKPLSQNQKQT